MQFKTLLSVASLVAVVACSAVPLHKREIMTNVTLYAYGTNISGLPILYGNGLAFVGAEDTTNLSSLTWEISDSGTDAWNATASSSNGTSTTGSFYIVDDGTSFQAAGFTSANTTSTSANITTTGFSVFGGQVIHMSDSMYEAQFWAQATGEEGVWSLMWNSDGSSQTDSVPVAVKTTAPVSATD